MDKQISHFKILEEIGSGGMGVVYRARDQRLRRKVALKVLPAGALAEPTIRERLMREAQTTSSLNHPHIVTVFEIHSAGDRDFIAMEFVEGQSLDHVIGEEGLSLELALRFAIQVADGLACAHEHGVIHRDLKPQNIMVTSDEEVKILDFGLAKRFLPSAGGDSSIEPGLMTLTAPGVKVGTPAYMSPEQIESRPIDARSDIFSFGCLLYQMLSGVNPFQRRNAILIFKAVLSDQAKPLRSLKPKLPVELDNILTRALAKLPEDRYQDMRQLLADLEAVHQQFFGTGVYPTRSGLIPAPKLPHKKNWRLPLLIATSMIAGALAIGWLASRALSPPRLSNHRTLANVLGAYPQANVSPIKAAGADGTDLAPLAAIPPAFFARWVERSPAFSPDGRSIAYFQPEVGQAGGLWVAPIDGGAPRRLFDDSFRGGDPVWTPDGRSIVFSADLSGEINLWCVPASGGEPQPLTHGAGRHTDASISADGHRLLYTAANPSFVLARQSFETGRGQQLLASRFEIMRPEVSPSGDRIAFFSPAGLDVHLFVIGPDGDGARQITDGSGERNIMPRWSADGSRIYYYQEQPTRSLRFVPATGGDSTVVLENWSWSRQYDSAVGPRGRRLVYVPIAGGAPQALQVLDLESGEELKLAATLLTPRWSADGTEVLGSDLEDRIYICPAGGGDCRFVADGFAPRWGPQVGSIAFTRRDAEPRDRVQKVSVWTLTVAGLEGRKVATVEALGFLGFGYGFLAGGDLIWNRMDPGHEEPWIADLK